MMMDRREYYRQWRLENPEKARESNARWRLKNREIIREKGREYYHKEKIKVINYYGGVCQCPSGICLISNPKFLTVDHIDNDGAAHRKDDGVHIYRWLIKNKFPPGFRILCWNCNGGRLCNKGICPHEEIIPQ